MSKTIGIIAAGLMIPLNAAAYDVDIELSWVVPTAYTSGAELVPEEVSATVCEYALVGASGNTYFGTEATGGSVNTLARTHDLAPGQYNFFCKIQLVDSKESAYAVTATPLTIPVLDKGDPLPPGGLKSFLD